MSLLQPPKKRTFEDAIIILEKFVVSLANSGQFSPVKVKLARSSRCYVHLPRRSDIERSNCV